MLEEAEQRNELHTRLRDNLINEVLRGSSRVTCQQEKEKIIFHVIAIGNSLLISSSFPQVYSSVKSWQGDTYHKQVLARGWQGISHRVVGWRRPEGAGNGH